MRRYTTLSNIRIQKLLYSVSHWWCQSACQNQVTPIRYSSIPESRSMEPIVICCCHNSCCLPYVRSMAFLISEFLIVQQDRARETFNLIQRETPAFISPDLWSPNNPDHSPVDYQIWGISESRQKCTGCGRFEAASDWCLDWYSTKRYLQ